ncbi:hypothetical protein PPM_2674 [Paenibacillus polymyxa M1]|uniref:hypothetical protein n=1 Tax=Paenibacillus polymyxa TaxID=1406 RepID=UPI00021BBD81|nr:hypothetical protein [Paenibacillus polymyxa]CCC85611.1 hypothetical protein PPM_2674 [Paenibacillus polymyxa M1]
MFYTLLIVISSACFVLFLFWGIISSFRRTKKARWSFLISLLSLLILCIVAPSDESKPVSKGDSAQEQADVSPNVSEEDVESTPLFSDADRKKALQVESVLYKYQSEMAPYEQNGAGVLDKSKKIDDAALCKELQQVNEKYKETIKKINSITIPDELHSDLKDNLENVLRSAKGYYTSRSLAYESFLKYIKEPNETHIDTMRQQLMDARDFSREYKMYVTMLFGKTGMPNDMKDKK